MKDKKAKAFEKLIKHSGKSRKVLRTLKSLAVDLHDYELASDFRDIEINNFPDAKETTKDYEFAKKIDTVLRMLNITIDLKTAFVVGRGVEAFLDKDSDYSVMDSSKILAQADKVFGE